MSTNSFTALKDLFSDDLPRGYTPASLMDFSEVMGIEMDVQDIVPEATTEQQTALVRLIYEHKVDRVAEVEALQEKIEDFISFSEVVLQELLDDASDKYDQIQGLVTDTTVYIPAEQIEALSLSTIAYRIENDEPFEFERVIQDEDGEDIYSMFELAEGYINDLKAQWHDKLSELGLE